MANFFQNIVNDFKRGVTEVVKPFKKPKQRAINFPVGEGLKPEQRQVTQQTKTTTGTNFFSDIVKDFKGGAGVIKQGIQEKSKQISERLKKDFNAPTENQPYLKAAKIIGKRLKVAAKEGERKAERTFELSGKLARKEITKTEEQELVRNLYEMEFTGGITNVARKAAPGLVSKGISFLKSKFTKKATQEIPDFVKMIKQNVPQQLGRYSPEAQKIAESIDVSKARDMDEALNMIKKALPGDVKQIRGIMPTFRHWKGSYDTVKLGGDATPEQLSQAIGKNVLNDIDDMLQSPRKLVNRFQESKSKLIQGKEKLRVDWTDRFAPIQSFVAKAKKITGVEIKPDENPYIAARIFSGIGGKVNNRLDTLGRIIKESGDQPNLSKYLLLKRMEERAGREFSNPRGIDIEEARKGLGQLKTQLGDNFITIENATKKVYQYSDDLLKYTRDNGIISEKTYSAIKAKNLNYTPFDVIDYIGEQADNIPRGSNAFSVGRQNLVKALQGTERDVADPLEALVRKTYKTIDLVERNKVAQKLIALRTKSPALQEVIIDGSKGIPKDFEKINMFRNGIKEEWAVPRGIGESMKSLGEKELDAATRLVGILNRSFRAGTTTYNAAFVVPNAIRDVQSAKIAAKHGFSFNNWFKGLFHVVKGKTIGDKLYQQWLEEGGSFSTRGQVFGGSIQKTLKNITEGRTSKAIKTIVNPIKLLKEFSEVIEETPRVGTFQRALKKGGSATEAAYEARNATVDFAKRGLKMKVANAWIPFLNARLQGNLNIIRAFKEHPAKAATQVALWIGAPTLTTYLYNRRQEGFDKVPQYVKDNYFTVITGTYKNKEGEVLPKMITIPKGDVGRFFGNPIENLLAFMDKKSGKSFNRIALQMFSDVSPITFAEEGKLKLTKAAGELLPPLPKAGIEISANKDFFRQQTIVPKRLEKVSPKYQAGKWTTETAKLIGEALNISPAKLEHVAKAAFGTVVSQPLQASDVVLKKTGIVKEKPSELTKEERIAKIPVVSRFFKVGRESDDKEWERLNQLEREEADRQFLIEKKAQEILEKIKTGKTKEEKKIALQEAAGDKKLEEKLMGLIKAEGLNLKSIDKKLRSLSPPERAKFIKEELKKIKDKDDKKDYLIELTKKGILTEETMESLVITSP